MATSKQNMPASKNATTGDDGLNVNLQEQALACSPYAEILTTEEFAIRIRSCRETIQAWKKAGILVNGRHYYGQGSHVTFPWPLSYIRMLEDKIMSGQTTTRSTNNKTPATVKKVRKSTINQSTKQNSSRIGTDF